MDDYNETSNDNLENITKALEDMDSLDMELFNDSFKKSKSTTSVLKDANMQSDNDIKKKVLFKSASNEDDLLSGLLSDEESPRKGKKNVLVSNSKSSLMEDLFKIRTPITSTSSIRSSNEPDSKFNVEQGEANQLCSQKPNSYLASKSSFSAPLSDSLKERNVQKIKNTSGNEDDVLTDLIDKSGGIEKARRQSFKGSLFNDKLDSSNTQDSVVSKNIKKVESENIIEYASTAQKLKSNIIDQSINHFSTESRKGRRNAKVINDPLGLLSIDLLPEQNMEQTKKENTAIKDFVTQDTKAEKDLPEWLGGSKKLQDKQLERQQEGSPKIDNKISIKMDSKTANDVEIEPTLAQHVSLLFGAQLNQQNALFNIQQQEHELRTATILSHQNDQLSKVSTTQHAVLHNQEEQFNALLKLQFERQALLEKQIKLQQERINQYIYTLTAMPAPIPSNVTSCNGCKSKSDEDEKDFKEEKEEMESLIKTLEIENTNLARKLSSINEKHDNELTYQAEFYERQISFLKEAMTKLEERVKQEIECLEIDYTTKFDKLKDEKLQIESQYKEEIHNLKNEHLQHVEEICKLHSENVQLLQKEYSNIIESISRAKQTEEQMIKTMTNRKFDIEDMLQKANFIIDNIQEKQKNLELKRNDITEFQENTFKLQEADIKAQRLQLEHQHNVLEEHRNKFVETTEKLDIRLTQLITELQKQNTLCNQAQETLEKRAVNLLREKELFEEKMKWERDYMQILKESWIKEQEKQLELLAKEKEAIATEKAQFEVLSKLKSNNGEIAKVELEAAITYAQEATVSATREKLRWQEKICDLNTHKQILQDKENLLISRAKELENLTQSALIKKGEGTKALKNAKHLENQNKERFNQLQTQLQALMEREKKVATERYNVTKGRMFSLAYETEKLERDVNVSHTFHNDLLPFTEIQAKSEVASELMDIVDPNIIMLKLSLNDEYDSMNQYM